MGPQGIDPPYWKQTAIAFGVVASWLVIAFIIGKITGFNGMRATGYVIMAFGVGLAAWNSLPSKRGSGLYIASLYVVAAGFYIALHRGG